MFFRRPQKDVDSVIASLASLGMDSSGRSLFLENEDISNEAALDFIKACGASEGYFRKAEDILRFASLYNTLVVFLNLRDKSFENDILTRFRDPDLLLRSHGWDRGLSEEALAAQRRLVERGYALFIDNLPLSERLMTIGLHELLASRFMNFLSQGRIGKEDDKQTWLIFSLVIYHELNRLSAGVAGAKKRLGL